MEPHYLPRRVTALGSLILALAATSTAAAAPQADLDLLAVSGEVLPGTATTLVGIGDLQSGADGGWVARAVIDTPTSSGESAILGDLSSDASHGPSVLRRPTLVAGFSQTKLGSPDFQGGQIGYLASEDTAILTRYQGAFIGDQLIARQGDAIGTTGRQWGTFGRIVLRPGGRIYLRGGSTQGGLLYAQHSETVLVSVGDPVATMAGPITNVGRFDISPNGEHWAAVVTAGPGNDAILVDGAVLMVGGAPVIERRAISATLGLGTGEWLELLSLDVDNDGRVTFQATTNTPIGGAPTIRGDRVIQLEVGPSEAPHYQDSLPGSLAVFVSGTDLVLEDQVIASASATFDADGDGQADAGYAIATSTVGSPDWQVVSVSEVLVGTVFVTVPGLSGGRQGLVRLQRRLEGDVTCAGVPNSTGRASSLTSFGRSGANSNDLTLYCVDLPDGCTAYAIGSRQSGSAPNPGGSTGNLCLGGAIGRFLPQMFTVDQAGRGTVELDLLALPQPMGAVAATAGDIWFFQVWHRDLCSGPTATSNFSNAISVQLTN
ncbi:hypothetical protein [Planctomycetes bacterium Poly30]